MAKALVLYKHDIVIAESVSRITDGRRERMTNMRSFQTTPQGSLPVTTGPRPISDYEIEALAEAEDAYST